MFGCGFAQRQTPATAVLKHFWMHGYASIATHFAVFSTFLQRFELQWVELKRPYRASLPSGLSCFLPLNLKSSSVAERMQDQKEGKKMSFQPSRVENGQAEAASVIESVFSSAAQIHLSRDCCFIFLNYCNENGSSFRKIA